MEPTGRTAAIGRAAITISGLAALALAAWRFGLDPRPIAAALAAERGWAAADPFVVAGLYVAVYTAAAAVCLPGAWAFSAAGGALFGFAPGFGLALAANAAGAALAMIGARRWLRRAALRRRAAWLRHAEATAARDGMRYVIAARLTPLVPFFAVNVAAGLAGMRLAPFVAASLIGAAPLVALSAWTGARWAADAQRGSPLSPAAAAGLVALAAAVLVVPPLARRWRARRVSRPAARPPSF